MFSISDEKISTLEEMFAVPPFCRYRRIYCAKQVKDYRMLMIALLHKVHKYLAEGESRNSDWMAERC